MSHACVCRFCGKVYMSLIPSTCCKKCLHLEEEEFSSIEEYLKKYPNSNAMQISEGLDISVLSILRYIDEGRLQVNKGTFKEINDKK